MGAPIVAERFSDSFLDELRERLPVSEVVGRRHKLRKEGNEFRSIDDNSLTVNDEKRLWWDHAKGKGGDIFTFEIETTGCTFREAVEFCANLAGISIPHGDGRPGVSHSAARNGASEPPPGRPEPPIDAYEVDARAAGTGGDAPIQRSSRGITKTYDYTDAQGQLIYQVCRLEWEEDGKHKKTFIQRRPTPEDDGHWIWGLGAGDYLQSRSGDWMQATKDRVQKWKGAKRRTIKVGADHGLYRLVEFLELKSPSEPVWAPEGEKDVDTLVDWGMVATTNSGGAKNWRPDHAELFRDLDVIIPIDNDDAGRDRANRIGESLQGIAKRIRVLDFGDAAIWPDAPKGADVTDWKRQREGTAAELSEITATLPDWSPPVFESKFGGIPFEDLDLPGPEHEYLIDGWITIGDKSVIGGASRSGKSFIACHKAMCITTGMDFFGCKVMTPGLVVYQAGEGARGIKKRFRAWRQYFGLSRSQRVPLYILQSKIDLYSAQGDTKEFIKELEGIAKMYRMPIRALFIDTLAKAQGIADENSGKDMAAVMANIDAIAEAVPGCHVALVHHFNAAGTKLRGHSSIYANIDQVILVTKAEDSKLRTAVLDKQKDDEDGAKIDFELQVVEIGQRPDGKPITSCVTLQVGGDSTVTAKKAVYKVKLTNERFVIFQALKQAIEDYGEPPPAMLKLPQSIKAVVDARKWKEVYLQKNPDIVAKDNTINKRLRDASAQFQKERIIGRENPYVWLTGRAVAGAIEIAQPEAEGVADDQQGSTVEDVPFDVLLAPLPGM